MRKIEEVKLISEDISWCFEEKVNKALSEGFEINEEISKFNTLISYSGMSTYTILLFKYTSNS